MSRSICMTCLAVVRDHDDPSPFVRLGLPAHKTPDGDTCPNPVGDFTWNNGHNCWDDDLMEYRSMDGGEPVEVKYGPWRRGE